MSNVSKATSAAVDVVEEIEFLSRSPKRVRILQLLSSRDGTEKDELDDAIEGARTTLSRNLDALEQRGLIRSDHRRYAITPSGEAVVGDLLEFVETMGVAVRFSAFFRWLDADQFDLDLHRLTDAEILTPGPGEPYAMIDRHVERLRQAEHVRALLPLTGLHAHEAVAERVVNGGTTVELIAAREVAESHRANPPYAELTADMMETGRLTYHVYDGEMPYGLVIADEAVQLMADEENEPRAVLESTDDDVREWASRTFEEYRRRSAPLFVDQ